MKTVLMITYVFPPAAWVGGHRTLKYCKYLGEHGWEPIVLTAKPIGVAFQDENLVRQIPGNVSVHRTFDLDPAKLEERIYAHRLQRSAQPAGQGGNRSNPVTPRRAGLFGQFKKLVKALLKESPDSHLFWVPFAILRGMAVLVSRTVDVIYCSTPPHSSHIVAYVLAKCAGKPYVLDFRDPWYVTGSARQPEGKVGWLLKIETRLKQRIVRGAARVICVSGGERDELRAEFPDLPADHFTFITNGFDRSDMPASATDRPVTSHIRLIHAGTIYPGIGDELFSALRRMAESEPGMTAAMQVHLVGDIAFEYLDSVRELEASGVVKAHGLQPHAETLRMVHESDVAVILMGGRKFQPSHLPSKAFEYLCVGKPVLAIAGRGELTDMLQRSGLGIIVPPLAVEELVETLKHLVADHAAGRLERKTDPEFINGFERARLAGKLANVLDSVKEAASAKQ